MARFNNVLPMIQFIFLILLVPTIASTSSSLQVNPLGIAKPDCNDSCGNVIIPFPFGMTSESCYLDKNFLITCNDSFTPKKPFLTTTNLEITDISLDGQLSLLSFVANDCYYPNGTETRTISMLSLPITFLTVNSTLNKFTIIGCDTYGYASGERLKSNYESQAECVALCRTEGDLEEGSCTGTGCCQVSIPEDIWHVNLTLNSFNKYRNVSGLNNCSYAFVAEEKAFTFSRDYLTNLSGIVPLMMPMVTDWAIGNDTADLDIGSGTNCEMAQMNRFSYACKGENVVCKNKTSNGHGYRCFCKDGYQGNPYLDDGCQDIDECLDDKLNNCGKDNCYNIDTGGYYCKCPKGYRGDGKKQENGNGCVRGEHITYKLVTGLALGVIVLVLAACWLHLIHKRKRMIKMRQDIPINIRNNTNFITQKRR